MPKQERCANPLNFKGFLKNHEVLVGGNVPIFVGKRHYVTLEGISYLNESQEQGGLQNYEIINPPNLSVRKPSHPAISGIPSDDEILSNSWHIFLVVGVETPISFPR